MPCCKCWNSVLNKIKRSSFNETNLVSPQNRPQNQSKFSLSESVGWISKSHAWTKEKSGTRIWRFCMKLERPTAFQCNSWNPQRRAEKLSCPLQLLYRARASAQEWRIPDQARFEGLSSRLVQRQSQLSVMGLVLGRVWEWPCHLHLAVFHSHLEMFTRLLYARGLVWSCVSHDDFILTIMPHEMGGISNLPPAIKGITRMLSSMTALK